MSVVTLSNVPAAFGIGAQRSSSTGRFNVCSLPPTCTHRLFLIAVLIAQFSGIGVGHAAEPVGPASGRSLVDATLPIHQSRKLHPELSDPVLGDQAQIAEWAWSSQYAKRAGLPVQTDGLADGVLWLVGIKVLRIQEGRQQRYVCRIAGLIDSKTSFLTPPGDRYVLHPSQLTGLPGMPHRGPGGGEQMDFVPAQAAWHRQPRTRLQAERPETGLGIPYIAFHRHFSEDLAYFELSASCTHFRDPVAYRNELRFPTRIDGKNDADKLQHAVYEPSAVKFTLPDSLMKKMYPYIREAEDWGSCLMRRSGAKHNLLSLRATKSMRFGESCEPQ